MMITEIFSNVTQTVIATVLAGAVVPLLITLVQSFTRIARIPVSHKISIIGLPDAGKTTLITALFEIVQRGEVVPGARLIGLKTIETVNRYVAKLTSNIPVGPTKEQDIFLFRFSYQRSLLIAKRTYDIEIADFPGEYSESIGGDSSVSFRRDDRDEELDSVLGYTLFRREFFSWIASSSVYVFVVDLSAVLSSNNPGAYVADLSARIRTSWQVIEDSASERGIGSARSRHVLLAFTKIDALLSSYHSNEDVDLSGRWTDRTTSPNNDQKLGSSHSLARQDIKEEDVNDELNTIRSLNDKAFDDLHTFFKSRLKSVRVVYTSINIRTKSGLRLGMNNIIQELLP